MRFDQSLQTQTVEGQHFLIQHTEMLGNFKADILGRRLSSLDHRIQIAAIYVLAHSKTYLCASFLLMKQEIQSGSELLGNVVIHTDNERAFAQ